MAAEMTKGRRIGAEKKAVFVFGVVFLTAILVLVIAIPYPTPIQFFAFRLTLALSAAGIGALLPGFLSIEVPLPVRGMIRAGGALALFSSVWFINPEDIGVRVKPPEADAGALIRMFLMLTDNKDHGKAYALFSSREQARITKSDYASMGQNVRDPRGGVKSRNLVRVYTPDELGGVVGPFVVHHYNVHYSTSPVVWSELITAIAEGGVWRIGGFQITPCLSPECGSISLPTMN